MSLSFSLVIEYADSRGKRLCLMHAIQRAVVGDNVSSEIVDSEEKGYLCKECLKDEVSKRGVIRCSKCGDFHYADSGEYVDSENVRLFGEEELKSLVAVEKTCGYCAISEDREAKKVVLVRMSAGTRAKIKSLRRDDSG
jgi:hypothetical protein